MEHFDPASFFSGMAFGQFWGAGVVLFVWWMSKK